MKYDIIAVVFIIVVIFVIATLFGKFGANVPAAIPLVLMAGSVVGAIIWAEKKKTASGDKYYDSQGELHYK